MNNEESASSYFSCSNWIAVQLEEKRIIEILDLQNPRILSFDDAFKDIVNHDYPNSILVSSEVNSWRLIMGSQLGYLNVSIYFLEQLSRESSIPIVSLGIDGWCGYYSWVYAKGGKVQRYYECIEGEVKEYGFKMEFEDEIGDLEDENCVFEISEKFGLDVMLTQMKDIQGDTTVWDFRQ